MADTPDGPLGQDDWDRLCFPGRLITFNFVACDDNSPIISFAIFDEYGAAVNYNYGGSWASFCSLPGYKFTVTAGGYNAKSVVVDSQMFNDRNVVVCLDRYVPPSLPPPTTGKWCLVSSALGLPADADDKVLALTRDFRALLNTGKSGSRLVEYVESEKHASQVAKIIDDPRFGARVMVVALRMLPTISEAVAAARTSKVVKLSDERPYRFDPDTSKAAIALIEEAQTAHGSSELLRELAVFIERATRMGIVQAAVAESGK